LLLRRIIINPPSCVVVAPHWLSFCFVNTNDPQGALTARSALQGYPLNGGNIKINDAIKRAENVQYSDEGELRKAAERMRINKTPLPTLGSGGVDYEAIRDDKGNPVCANLWVGGFNQNVSCVWG